MPQTAALHINTVKRSVIFAVLSAQVFIASDICVAMNPGLDLYVFHKSVEFFSNIYILSAHSANLYCSCPTIIAFLWTPS